MTCLYQVVEKFFTKEGVKKVLSEVENLQPMKASVSSGMREDYRKVTARNFGTGYDW